MAQKIKTEDIRLNKLFKTVFDGFRQERPKYAKSSFFKSTGVEVYINNEATYFTAEIGKDKWAFNYRESAIVKANEDNPEIDDRIELLLLDAFEKAYEEIYNSNYSEKIKQDSLIDKLFKNFVERRKLETPNQAILNIKKPNKIYI